MSLKLKVKSVVSSPMDSQSGVTEENTTSSKGIRKKVKNSESVALQRYKVDTYDLLELDKVLNDVYCSCRPVSADYDTRKDLVERLNAMALDIYGNSKDSSPVLEAFGSFVMDMFSPQSDLDVSINFGNETSELPRDTKIQILRRFAQKLRSLLGEGRVKEVVSILSARVPIVRFVEQGTCVQCDLSVQSKDGILTARIIQIMSRIDDRFQKLCMLIKHWAKAHEVNSAAHSTLNSISITLLVAHHLQTQDPPILPPFSELFKDGTDPSNVEKRTQKFLNWGQRNKESLGRLFVTFFLKMQSIEFLWGQGLCVSLLNGLWISKNRKKGFNVEDFIDASQNVARAVTNKGAEKIYCSINRTVEDLFEYLNGKIDGTHLKDKLFVPQAVVEPPPPPPVPPVNVYPRRPRTNYRNEFDDHHHNKKARFGNGHIVQRYGGRFGGKEPMHVGLWVGENGGIDLPPPPPPFGRVYDIYCKTFGPQNSP